jgi:phosphatidylglycerol:prolipoprotein diacylglycerol transferase
MYKDGVVRHNLGLYEAIYSVGIAILVYLLGRRRRSPGFFLGLFMIVYAPFRFAADFLRIVDVRYLGLTPGQYGCIALAVAGAALLITRRHAGDPQDRRAPVGIH